MKQDHEWFTRRIYVDRGSKKAMLILCILSGSDVWSKWRLLYSLLHKTIKSLNRRYLLFPAPESIQQTAQFTQGGGAKVRRSCQSNIVGGAWAELHHSDRTLRTAWFEKEDFKIGIKKKHLIINHIYVQTTCKVSFASDDLLKLFQFTVHLWPCSTKAVISSTGIFVVIANNTLYGSKLYIFLLCQKSLGY